MIHCQKHWSQLREALVLHKLGPILGQTYTPLNYIYDDTLDGALPEWTRDAMWDACRVVATLLIMEGQYDILTGNHCPVCEKLALVNKNGIGPIEFMFTDYPAKMVSEGYVKLGLTLPLTQ